MTLIKSGKLVVSLAERRLFHFSIFRGSKRKEQYDDLENKHLYWCINNMKKEYLNESKENVFEDMENYKLEENISDIVGIKSDIPDNSEINEKTEKYLFRERKYKKWIDKDKLKEINKIFNPSLKKFIDKEKNDEKNSDNFHLKWKELHQESENTFKPINRQNNCDKIIDDVKYERIKEGHINSYMNNKVEKIMKIKKNVNYSENDDFLKKTNCKIFGEKHDSLCSTVGGDVQGEVSQEKKFGIQENSESLCKEGEVEEYNFKDFSRNKELSIFDYESMKGNSMYQDLTHDEYEYMNNLYLKKCNVDRKIRWFKMSNMLNPVKEAKSILNSLKLSKDERKKKHSQGMETEEGEDKQLCEYPLREDIKPYYEDEGHFAHKIKKICEQNQYDEIVSRIRMKIRKEKLENSKIIKEKIPNVARHILDPIKYHINRRRVRVEKLLHTHLEQLLNCNNSYFRSYLLNGLSISIHHLEMKSTRSLCKIVYSLLNKNIKHEMIQEKLDKVAFILRKLLARKLQLGYTPPLKFVPLQDEQEKNIKNIQYYKLYAKYNYPTRVTGDHEKSKKLMDFYSRDLAGF
ncbi:conserved Plasmodium protein, unknown function [Plasmodium ovale]|uniref:Ribosome-binding factor A n=2 Tax=Plasmodium ovale TaxID=36330 RepID=A0A1A8WZZ5_PLAOA|nr:conserved Plasmodium protein, unknown function [Plasmodium ovale curtisi]SBS98564.1 conserved Plasmodium protein, unknown function [Plasmodium ovale curtisi]SCQ17214.1 conserved Plasmodium protein, unknown function [Plasmodium ovale]